MRIDRIARATTVPLLAATVVLAGSAAGWATQEDDEQRDRDRDRREQTVAEATFGDVTVEVTDLERTSNRTVTVRFVMANGGTADFDVWDHFGEFVNDWTMGGVYLFDEANSTKYLSLRLSEDQGGACVCTELESSIESIEPGRDRQFFVKFPAPPRSTTEVAVVLPPLGALDGVELEE
jgi:hypothetical protein